MRLFTTCPSCKKQISFVRFVESRVDFAQAYGKTVNIKCRHCGKTSDIHINDVRAKTSKFASILALSIFLIGAPLVVYLTRDYYRSWLFWMGPAATIIVPSLTYAIIHNQDQARVSAFNRSKVGDRVRFD